MKRSAISFVLAAGFTAFGSSILAGCVGTQQPMEPFSPARYSRAEIRKTIADDARNIGSTPADGFYYGEESRNFKTAYAVTTPEQKADWSLDYMDMLSGQGENMLKDWNSYVPYSKRAEFAEKWWLAHNPDFAKQNKKMKIIWIHESLMDGGELWFRAIEKLAKGRVESADVLTHDEEQRLVSKWAESQHREGSLSTQFH